MRLNKDIVTFIDIIEILILTKYYLHGSNILWFYRIGYKYPDPPTTNVIFPFQIDDNLKLDASQIELALSELNIKLSAQQSHRF